MTDNVSCQELKIECISTFSYVAAKHELLMGEVRGAIELNAPALRMIQHTMSLKVLIVEEHFDLNVPRNGIHWSTACDDVLRSVPRTAKARTKHIRSTYRRKNDNLPSWIRISISRRSPAILSRRGVASRRRKSKLALPTL